MKIQTLVFFFAKIYSYLYGFLKDNFNIHILGLGFILRQVKSDHQLLVNGRHLYFSHEMAEAYSRPMHSKWNVPEMHKLIFHGMDKLEVSFVEVGQVLVKSSPILQLTHSVLRL